MPDTLRLDVDAADELAVWYDLQARLLEGTARGIGRTFDLVDHLLPTDSGVLAANISARLVALAERLHEGGDEVRWRVAYVRAREADGIEIAAPTRDQTFARIPLHFLVGYLGGRNNDAALRELAIRVSMDPDLTDTIVRQLGVDGLRTLNAHMSDTLNEAFWNLAPELPGDYEERQVFGADVRRDLEGVFADYGVLLAAMSHTTDGRPALFDAWEWGEPDSLAINNMAIALLHGVWDTDFLLAVTTVVFTETNVRSTYGARIIPTWQPEGILVYPELYDPHALVIEALARNPEAARRFLTRQEGYALLTASDPLRWNRNLHGGHAMAGLRFDDAMAELLLAGLSDPDHRDGIGRALVDGPGRDANPLLEMIHLHDLPGPATADAWAQVLAMHWDRLVGPTLLTSAPANDLANATTALFDESDDALPILLAGFGPFLEATYAAAYASGDDAALAGARDTIERGFLAMADGLEEVEPGSDEHARLRSAFQALLGYGTKTGLTALGVTGPVAFLASYGAGELNAYLAERLIPMPEFDERDGQTLMDDFFRAGDSFLGSSVPIPPPAHIGLANSVLAANPEFAASLDHQPWLAGGAIEVPGDEATLIEFGAWFYETFETDAWAGLVIDESEHLAGEASTWIGSRAWSD